jgi:hypothetical protein
MRDLRDHAWLFVFYPAVYCCRHVDDVFWQLRQTTNYRYITIHKRGERAKSLIPRRTFWITASRYSVSETERINNLMQGGELAGIYGAAVIYRSSSASHPAALQLSEGGSYCKWYIAVIYIFLLFWIMGRDGSPAGRSRRSHSGWRNFCYVVLVGGLNVSSVLCWTAGY